MGDEIGQRGGSRIRDALIVAREAHRDTPELYEFGSFRLEPAERKLMRGNEAVVLTPKAFDTLVLLVRNSGHLLEKDELIRILWPDSFVEEGNLSNNIFLLRKALGEDPPYIETIPKRGYRFAGAVRQLPNAMPIRLENPPGAERGFANQVFTERRPSTGKSVLRRSVAAGVAGLVLLCVAIWRNQPRPPTVTAVDRITNDGRAKNAASSVVTDGVRLYFIEGLPWTTGSGIAQVSATGGETTWMTTTLQKAVAIFGISPDRSELLVGRFPAEGADLTGLPDASGELWVQPLPAGAPHRVGNFYASAATWTPDGMHIVYAVGRAIMIANTDGSEPHPLAWVSGVVERLRFSPDGRRIRFALAQRHEESKSIWEMDAGGKDIHLLFPDWKESTNQCCGNWSPDGDFYYFQAERGGTQAIWAMPERSSIFHRLAKSAAPLTSGPLRFSGPVPSGDGKRLFIMGEERRVELFRYDLQARRFESYLPGLSAGPVDFSPDRKWMAYVSFPDMTLWRSRVDGSEKTQLTFPPVRAYEPRWSPDGSKIAFMDVQLSHPWKIRLLSSSGGSPELLVKEGGQEPEDDPTWTPDGKSIVFARSDATRQFAIYRLDFNTQKVSPIPDSKGLFSPRMSPDGRYICALSWPDTKLMLFDTSTNHWSSLVEGKQLGYTEWSHDGKYVYMREALEGTGEIVRIGIKDRVLEQVVSLKDFPQLIDMFAAWIGLTPDDSPLLLRDRSVQEIYALDLRFD
jgi:Tol biopolymer transport system component/DNA-binding winged helix-turn-helix (wHTH) protein